MARQAPVGAAGCCNAQEGRDLLSPEKAFGRRLRWLAGYNFSGEGPGGCGSDVDGRNCFGNCGDEHLVWHWLGLAVALAVQCPGRQGILEAGDSVQDAGEPRQGGASIRRDNGLDGVKEWASWRDADEAVQPSAYSHSSGSSPTPQEHGFGSLLYRAHLLRGHKQDRPRSFSVGIFADAWPRCGGAPDNGRMPTIADGSDRRRSGAGITKVLAKPLEATQRKAPAQLFTQARGRGIPSSTPWAATAAATTAAFVRQLQCAASSWARRRYWVWRPCCSSARFERLVRCEPLRRTSAVWLTRPRCNACFIVTFACRFSACRRNDDRTPKQGPFATAHSTTLYSQREP
mmetsp:Transcript_112689/g.318428  ORF Transcript_112689/g.318428 Transcript_112689/m.318428 type:complete len:345 (-) Transcript_112689:26-1060(-)